MDIDRATLDNTQRASELVLSKWIKEMPYNEISDSNKIIPDSMPDEGVWGGKTIHLITMDVDDVIPSGLSWFIYWAYLSVNNYVFIFPMEDVDIMFSVITGNFSGRKLTLALKDGNNTEQIYVPESSSRYGWGYHRDLDMFLNRNVIQAKFSDGTPFSAIKTYFNDKEVRKTIVNLSKDVETIKNISEKLSKVTEIFSNKLKYELSQTDSDSSYRNKTINLPSIITNSKISYNNTILLSGNLDYKQIGKIVTNGKMNPIEVKDFLTSIFFDLNTYVPYPTDVQIGYKIGYNNSEDNEPTIDITIKFKLELITLDDYYNTIGYYHTRIKNICKKESRYAKKEIYDISEDLGLDVNNLTDDQICEKLRNFIYGVSIKDFENN